jgi:hypothetical protein
MSTVTPAEVVTTLPAIPSGGGLVAAIAAIMSEVHVVVKRGENEFHGYRYATMGDILKEITPLLGRHGLVIFQSETGRAMFDSDNVVAIEYAFTVVHVSGETWPAIKQTGASTCRNSKGGWDDKSLNKCHTAARKYFLLALFQIPTGGEDDADHGDDDRPAKVAARTICRPDHFARSDGRGQIPTWDDTDQDKNDRQPAAEVPAVVRRVRSIAPEYVLPPPSRALRQGGIAERALTTRYEQAVRSVGPSQPFLASEAGKAFSPRFRASAAGYDERNPPPHDTVPDDGPAREAAKALNKQLHPMRDELPEHSAPPKEPAPAKAGDDSGIPGFLDRRKADGAEPSFVDLVGEA